jgi:membrane-bound serine protease (ClpP class)
MMMHMELVIALLVVGGLLILAETILPGMIAGILGFLCLTAGVAVGYARFGSPTGNYILLGVVAALVIGTFVWLKVFPGTRLAGLFISQRTVGDLGVEQPSLLNQTGAALSSLRPSGMALIGGKRVDVVTEGGMVEKGTPIKVVALEGLRVVVRPLSQDSRSEPIQTQTQKP